jgi:cation transport ATPase
MGHLVGQEHIARSRLHLDRDQVAHCATRQEERRLLAQQRGRALKQAIDRRALALLLVSRDGRLLGVLGLADTLRALGVQHLVMLTGDHRDVAQQIAQQTGLTDVRADLLPENEITAVKELQPARAARRALRPAGVALMPPLRMLRRQKGRCPLSLFGRQP